MIQPETAPKSHFEKLNRRLLPPFWSSSHITSRAQCSKSASTQDFARKSSITRTYLYALLLCF